MEKPKQINFIVDDELRTKFKVKCAKNGEDMRTPLIKFIKKYVK